MTHTVLRGDRKRRRLAKLHGIDPHCRSCRRLTVLHDTRLPGANKLISPDMAVLARWLASDDPRYAKLSLGDRRRLTCWECANERNKAQEMARPIDELHWRSGMFGPFDRALVNGSQQAQSTT